MSEKELALKALELAVATNGQTSKNQRYLIMNTAREYLDFLKLDHPILNPELHSHLYPSFT